MAWCEFADRSVPGNSPGSYRGGPWKVLIHTTEGGSAEGAFGAYRANNTWPHFTVDPYTVYQHVDTQISASAVLNESGGVETNRLQAIQIEMVGYAGKPKDPQMLEQTARLLRWLEELYGIPREWPNGRPQGQNGPHNRSSSNWTKRSGYYGHSQVPENHHWDPGYLSDDELAVLMGEEMQPAHTFINGVDVATTVRSWLAEGNSLIDASEFCAYAGYPAPVWDNAWADDVYAGALKISTRKVLCELLRENASPCPNPSDTFTEVGLADVGASVKLWVCAEHRAQIETTDAPEAADADAPAPAAAT